MSSTRGLEAPPAAVGLRALVGRLEAPGLAPEQPPALGQALAPRQAVLAGRPPFEGQARAPPPALPLALPRPVLSLQSLMPVAVIVPLSPIHDSSRLRKEFKVLFQVSIGAMLW
jgi:hypothetical protein